MTSACIGVSIDLTWMNAKSLEDLQEVEPVNAQEIASPDPSGRVRPLVGIKLCYNKLQHLSGNDFLNSLDKLTHGHGRVLRLLDLSFNEITSIRPLARLTELTTLYLHSNKIACLKEVEHLKALVKLRKLTLHSNPVATRKEYRRDVLSVLRNLPLQMVDFSCITHREEELARLWPASRAEPEEGAVDVT